MNENDFLNNFFKEVEDLNHSSVQIKGNINDEYFRDSINELKSKCKTKMIFDSNISFEEEEVKDRLEGIVSELKKIAFLDSCRNDDVDFDKFLIFVDMEKYFYCRSIRETFKSSVIEILKSSYLSGYKVISIDTGYNSDMSIPSSIDLNFSKKIIFRQHSKLQYMCGTYSPLSNYINENKLFDKEHFTVIERSSIKHHYIK